MDEWMDACMYLRTDIRTFAGTVCTWVCSASIQIPSQCPAMIPRLSYSNIIGSPQITIADQGAMSCFCFLIAALSRIRKWNCTDVVGSIETAAWAYHLSNLDLYTFWECNCLHWEITTFLVDKSSNCPTKWAIYIVAMSNIAKPYYHSPIDIPIHYQR